MPQALRDLFALDVTRNIPPVVYFHEQSPQRLAAEVSEYIITGGYADDDPRRKADQQGIHEALVNLLERLREGIQRPGGPELPAAWISGFYGSGKSSFAKLLGLSLDNVRLPDQRTLAEALLARDDSPRRHDLAAAWEGLTRDLHTRAVVFDIGGVARDGEHIHVAALRQVQRALGYCPHSSHVAAFELALETDGLWRDFEQAAREVLGKPWSAARDEALAEDHFSHVMHHLQPTRYRDPTSWIDTRAGIKTGAGTSVSEAVEALGRMMDHRCPRATLFLVIDEVSQYIHQDEGRMLALQSWVAELGQRLRGRVWLLATGQQKLDTQSGNSVLAKLKDRFPSALRVHLTNSNIRDVVHKRLLQKRPEAVPALQQLFRAHRADLKRLAYGCEDIAEQDFVEVYPLLPGHIDLLLDITTAIRIGSTRAQSDDQTLRGLLQLLGELFRERKLADRPVGTLIALDEIYEVQRTALHADLQNSLARLLAHEAVVADPLAVRVVKAVALLQQVQDGQRHDNPRPTTDEFVARCLYARLGEANAQPAVREVLERLRGLNLLAYSERTGYKVQSAAGQEWERTRADLLVDQSTLVATVRDQLKALLDEPERPKLRGNPFAWSAWFGDEHCLREEHIKAARGRDVEAPVDLRLLFDPRRRLPERWAAESDVGPLRDRLVWVADSPGAVEEHAREYVRSVRMIDTYARMGPSVSYENQRLLLEERTRAEGLQRSLQDAIKSTFLDGRFWFRGGAIKPRDHGATFGAALLKVMTDVLPKLYPSYVDVVVKPAEYEQLLQKELSGLSAKFFERHDGAEGLGFFASDSKRVVATCTGAVPTAVAQSLAGVGGRAAGLSGGDLLNHFAGPPYGWSPDVVKAAVVALVRASRVSVQTAKGKKLSSVLDEGARELFLQDREFRLASFFPASEGEVTARDRTAICRWFADALQHDLDRDNDAIAEAVWETFPTVRGHLKESEARLVAMACAVPDTFTRLGTALQACQSSRKVEEIVLAVKRHLDALRDGAAALYALRPALTAEAEEDVRALRAVVAQPLRQLEDAGQLGDLRLDAARLRAHAQHPTPWVDHEALRPLLSAVRMRYRAVRAERLAGLARDVDEARAELSRRAGFDTLDPDTAHAVLRPFAGVLLDARAEDESPSLNDLTERTVGRLLRAREEAHRLLDEALAAKRTVPVRPLKVELRGREVGSLEELDALLAALRARVADQLRAGARVRLE